MGQVLVPSGSRLDPGLVVPSGSRLGSGWVPGVGPVWVAAGFHLEFNGSVHFASSLVLLNTFWQLLAAAKRY